MHTSRRAWKQAAQSVQRTLESGYVDWDPGVRSGAQKARGALGQGPSKGLRAADGQYG